MSPEALRPHFERLEPHMPDVAAIALLAVRQAAEDPEGAVVKARRVTEAILKATLPAAEREQRLTIEQLKGRVRLPARELALVDLIQRLGNEAAHHRDTRLSPDDARRALDALAGLSEWYLRVHVAVVRPRRRRWGSWLAGGALAVGGALAAAGMLAGLFAVVGGGTVVAVRAAREAQTVTSASTPAPAAPAPAPAASVAVTPPAPEETADRSVAVPMWSRPPLPGEAAPDEQTGAAAPARTCAGPIRDWRVHAESRGWALATAQCGAREVAGWFDAAAVRAAGGAVAAVASTPENPGERETRLGSAEFKLRSGQYERAIAALDPLVAAVPEDPRALRARGLARLRGGDTRRALDDLAACVALEPTADRGACDRYAAEALIRLDAEGSAEALERAAKALGAVATPDRALLLEIVALQGHLSVDAPKLPDLGDDGVPLVRADIRPAAAKKVRSERPGADPRELCRLRGGEPYELAGSPVHSARIRVVCDGEVREGYVPKELVNSR